LHWFLSGRCSSHRSIPQIQSDLWDDYGIKLSADSMSRSRWSPRATDPTAAPAPPATSRGEHDARGDGSRSRVSTPWSCRYFPGL